MLGTWTVERRAPGATHDVMRVSFYRDGRFGALAADGRTRLWGSWKLDPASAPLDPTEHPGRVTLRYDHDAARGGEFRLAFASPPHGPLTLTADHGAPARLDLVRAMPLDAALIGTWHAGRAQPERGESPVESLALQRDGGYVVRLAGAVVRRGRWAFDRLDAVERTRMAGTLELDPTEHTAAVERWAVTRLDGAPPALLVHLPGVARTARLDLLTLDPFARPLLATWRRFTSAATTRVPQEFTLGSDGALDVLPRAGSPRTAGRWMLAAIRRGPDRIFATLALSTRAPGHAAETDRWHVVLPFARNGELEVYSERDAGSARCRRLFR